MAIRRIKIRARIEVSGITAETPYIQSFNVNKRRGQVSTFDASLKVSSDSVGGSIAGGMVVIYAGEGDSGKSNKIFTGICRAAKISPCFDDPKYVILSISGADQMSLLEGKRYTRRCRSSQSTWTAITGVIRKGLKSGKFAYTREPTIELNPGTLNSDSVQVAHGAVKSNVDTVGGKLTNPGHRDKPDVPQIYVTILNQAVESPGE